MGLLVFFVSAGPASAAEFALPGQFDVNQNGAAVYSIPIAVPPGTAGMAPSLTLDYNSQSGNGIVGVGWSLGGLPAVTHCARTMAQDGIHGGVNYDANDRYCLDGQRLMAISGTYGADGAEYRTEIDGFTRIISHGTAGNGPAWFEVHTKTGQIMQFGNTTDSQILALGKTTARAWAVNKISDTAGNYLTVTYTNGVLDTTYGQTYPTNISYTGNSSLTPYNSIQFVYNTSRPDQTPTYQAGSLVETTVLLTDIKTYAQGGLVSDYKLTYQQPGGINHNSELTSVQRFDSTGNSLPATTFGWQGSRDTLTVTATGQSFTQNKPIVAGDYNGDGLSDMLVGLGCTTSGTVYFGTVSGTSYTASSMTAAAITGGATCIVGAADFNGDGYPDLLTQAHTTYIGYDIYIINDYLNTTSNIFGSAHNINAGTTADGYKPFSQPIDFNGDGKADLFFTQEVSGAGSGTVQISNGDGTFTAGTASSAYNPVITATYFGDFDGDGCTDLLAQPLGTGGLQNVAYSCNPAVSSVSVANWTGASGTSLVLGDFNGDGKTDVLVVSTSANSILYLSTGTGFTAGITLPSSAGWGTYQIVTGDWNGDGKTDIALISPVSSASHVILLSTGTGFVTAATIANSDNNAFATMADWNNDGASDLWIQKASGDTEYTFSFAPELMTSVTTGLGATTSITYDRLNHGTIYTRSATIPGYPTQNVVGPMYVVSRVDSSNGVGGNYSSTYAYAGAQVDLTGRGFLGFAQMVATDLQTGIVQTTNYLQTFPYIGLVSSQTKTYGAITLNQTTNSYSDTVTTVSGMTRYFPFMTGSVRASTDLDGSALPTITTSYTYDVYGNATQVTTSTPDGYSQVTANTYNNDTANWFLGRLLTAQVTNTQPGGANLTRQTSYAYDSGTGLLTQSVIEPSASAFTQTTAYAHDAYGNVTITTVSGTGITTRSSTVSYDSYGRFPATVSNALGQSETRVYDARFGGMTSQTGPNSLTTTWSYDTFGRKTNETRPDATQTNWTYTSVAGGLSYTGITATAAPSETHYYDILERETQVIHQGFDGTPIYEVKAYDSLGRVYQAARPYFSGATVYNTTYTYDTLGRVTLETRPDLSTVQYAYHGLTASVTDPLSHTTTTVKNSQGQVYTVTDPAGTTTYAYDPFGNTTGVTDPAGNVVSMAYDIRGRKTSMSDPDLGYWTYGYDVLNELTSQTDAKGQSTMLTYDVLGRITNRAEADLNSSWTYDTASMGIGKLATATTSAGYSRSLTYDSLGRPSSTAITIDGTAYTTTTSYDSYSRLSAISYPSGLNATYSYNGYGYLSSVANGSTGAAFWTANTRDASFNLTSQTYGNGVSTSQGFDPTTGRLLTIQTGPASGPASVQNLAYVWDVAGNLTSRVDGTQGVTEGFTYDTMNRLATANIAGGAAKTYTYDSIGDITSKSDVGTYYYPAAGSARPHGVTSIAGGTNNGTGVTGGVTNPTYAYDANGNMTSGGGRVLSYSSFNVPSCIASGLTTCAAGGSNTLIFTFDSEHQRIKQVAPEGTTRYINAGGVTIEQFTASGGAVTWRSYIMAAGQTIGVQYLTGGTGGPQWGSVTWGSFSWGAATTYMRYFHTDHLSSVAVLTDDSGAIQGRNAYDPWGKLRNLNGTDDTYDALSTAANRGYTDQEHLNDVALIHLNARVYDPQIGKFTSADPMVGQPYSSQGWNRYAYVGNNPLAFTDPTGMCFLGCFWKSPIFKAVVAIAAVATVNYEVLAIEEGTTFSAATIAAASSSQLAVAAGVSGAIGGAISTGTLKGAVIGALTAEAFFGAGSLAAELPAGFQTAGQIALDGTVGGLSSVASGGNFQSGFLAAGFSAGADAIETDNFEADIAVHAVSGGLGSVLGGGKFANGAITGAFGYLFNSRFHSTTAVPFTDDQGNIVTNLAGDPMQRPSDVSPNIFVDYGSALMDANPDGTSALAALIEFGRGGTLDVQRVGTDKVFIGAFTDFANVAIGLYAASAGIPQNEILSIANQVGASSHFAASAIPDPTYPNLRLENVYDIKTGYRLFQSGQIGPSPSH